MGWRAPIASVVARRSVVVDAEALAFIFAPTVTLFFPLAVPPIDDVASIAVIVNGAASIRDLALASLCPIPATRLPG